MSLFAKIDLSLFGDRIIKDVLVFQIVHRYLKAESILLDSEKHFNICDFDISTLSTDHIHTNNIGTSAYMSPEQHNNDPNYKDKVDVYSFACIVLFILTKGQHFHFLLIDVIQGTNLRIPT